MMKKATGASVLLLLLFSWVLTDAQATTTQYRHQNPWLKEKGKQHRIFWFFEGKTELGSDFHVD